MIDIAADVAIFRRLGEPDKKFSKLWWCQLRPSTEMGLTLKDIPTCHFVAGWQCDTCKALFFITEMKQLDHICNTEVK